MKRIFNLQPVADGCLSRRAAGSAVWRRLVNRLLAYSFPVVVAGACLLGGVRTARAEGEVVLDYQVKAAYLLNFPKYVDWPAGTLAETNSPITVAIFGDSDVAGEFGKMIEAGKRIGGHPLVLKRISKEEEITKDCQIVFIAISERARMQSILDRLKDSNVLTVGESDDFLASGGVINLVHRDRKIRLQVNLVSAEKAHLKISSRLLVVAEVVKGKPE